MRSPGARKWAALFGVVVALEALPGDTLTQAHLKALAHPQGKTALLGTHAFLVAHLWGIIPRRLDPLVLLAEKLRVTAA